MMPQLVNKSNNRILAQQIEVAKTFFQRSKGLLGRDSLAVGDALWIHQCSSIHTWFMKFNIDAVFVDKNLKVKSIKYNLRPWRLVFPVWMAHSVFEFPGGHIKPGDVNRGDLLDVVD